MNKTRTYFLTNELGKTTPGHTINDLLADVNDGGMDTWEVE